jgi:hypothetical protein
MINVTHASLSNSSHLLIASPLEPYAKANSTGERHSKFFGETVHSLIDAHSPLDIYGIIYDNLLVQIAGLHAFLAHRAEHVP